jgi:hypothetical protein
MELLWGFGTWKRGAIQAGGGMVKTKPAQKITAPAVWITAS